MLDTSGTVRIVLAEVISAVDQAIDGWFTGKLAAVLEPIAAKLDQLNAKLDAQASSLIAEEAQLVDITAELANLKAQVEANTSTEESAITLLNQLGDLMRANADAPDQIRALADQVQAEAANLGGAVAANVVPPVEPTP